MEMVILRIYVSLRVDLGIQESGNGFWGCSRLNSYQMPNEAEPENELCDLREFPIEEWEVYSIKL